MTSCAFNGNGIETRTPTRPMKASSSYCLTAKVQAGQGRCRVNTFISQKTREKESNIQGSLLSKSSNVTFHHMGAPHRDVLEYTQPPPSPLQDIVQQTSSETGMVSLMHHRPRDRDPRPPPFEAPLLMRIVMSNDNSLPLNDRRHAMPYHPLRKDSFLLSSPRCRRNGWCVC